MKVSEAFGQLGVAVKNEWVEENTGHIIDIYLPGEKILVEVDGMAFHFLKATDYTTVVDTEGCRQVHFNKKLKGSSHFVSSYC